MTPQELRDARDKLGLTQSQLGTILGLGDPGRHVRLYEAGDVPMSGPVKLAMRYLIRYGLDREARKLIKAA